MDPRILKEYRKQRTMQLRLATTRGPIRRDKQHAQIALRTAKQEIALQHAEYEDRIRFEWTSDEFPWENSDRENAKYATNAKERREYERYADEWDRKVRDGYLTVECCSVQVPVHVTKTRDDEILSESDEWEPAYVSLCGIEIDGNDEYGYRREIERELAAEAGIL